jgi:hypothetical protein|tara:strand:+ start:589 stop:936 length:348 start_codon:yes stop_codon:yes gene_type:complete
MDYKKEEIKEYFDDFIKDQDADWIDEIVRIASDAYDAIHYYAFNTDYYIIGTYQAKEWLGNMAFDVINFIKDYEQDNFGEVSTDLSDPERVVNMYVYIIGEEIVWEYLAKLEDVA